MGAEKCEMLNCMYNREGYCYCCNDYYEPDLGEECPSYDLDEFRLIPIRTCEMKDCIYNDTVNFGCICNSYEHAPNPDLGKDCPEYISEGDVYDD